MATKTTITKARIEAAQRAVDAGGAAVTLRDTRVPGLSLGVGPGGGRWRLDYKAPLAGGGFSAGRRLVLGDAAAMTLEQAREAAAAAKASVAGGTDPAAAKRAHRAANVEAASSRTVSAAIERFEAERAEDWTAATREALRSDLALIAATFGGIPMAMVTRADLVAFINDRLADQRRAGFVGVARTERIAKLLGGLWRQAGSGSRSRPGWEWGVDPIVADRLPVVGRHRLASRKRTLTEGEIRSSWAALRDGVPGVSAGAGPRLALQISLVTGMRIGAVALTRVADVTLDPAPVIGSRDTGPTLRVPATDGTKASARERREGSDLIVPLSPLAVALFREALRIGGGGPFVFPGRSAARPLTSGAVSKAWTGLAAAGAVPADTTAHDLRRTMRTGLSEVDHPGSWGDEELLIGHKLGGSVSQTYDRGRRLVRLRPIADAWGARLAAIVDNPPAPVHRLREGV